MGTHGVTAFYVLTVSKLKKNVYKCSKPFRVDHLTRRSVEYPTVMDHHETNGVLEVFHL